MCIRDSSLFVQQLRKSFFHADFEWPFSTHCKGIPGTTDLCSNWRPNTRLLFFFHSSLQDALIKLFSLFLNLLATLHTFQGKKCQPFCQGCKILQRWTKGLIFFFNGHDVKYNPHFHALVQYKILQMYKTHNLRWERCPDLHKLFHILLQDFSCSV